MRIILVFLMSLAALAADSGFNGRWDLSVLNEPRARVWWLEVTGAGTPNMAGRFVGAPGGGMDPITQIAVKNGELEFSLKGGTYHAKLVGNKLEGTYEGQSGKLNWTGVRAPQIREHDDGSWRQGEPIELFDGKDLKGWHSRLAGHEIGWQVTNGLLNNGNAGVPDLVSDRNFWNFTLHIEYRIGKKSNSGIGLRGRYEVQILDDSARKLDVHSNGALYSRIVPSMEASRPPGEWQAFDIRLVGRDVTVVLNDEKIIDKRVIEGLTAIANNPDEAKPGPIILQGDHGPVEFRKITLTPLLK